jgi:hypothetical protein
MFLCICRQIAYVALVRSVTRNDLRRPSEGRAIFRVSPLLEPCGPAGLYRVQITRLSSQLFRGLKARQAAYPPAMAVLPGAFTRTTPSSAAQYDRVPCTLDNTVAVV